MTPDLSVAFLRGINVGGNALIKMPELKKAFETAGFNRVTTLLASGNVVFQAPGTGLTAIKNKLGRTLKAKFGLEILVILRTGPQILKLVESEPFKRVKPTQLTRLHVTFLSAPVAEPRKFPYRLPAGDFQVVLVSPEEVCSVVEASEGAGTPELMKFLEKQFGKSITTRTWNTVQKIAQMVMG